MKQTRFMTANHNKLNNPHPPSAPFRENSLSVDRAKRQRSAQNSSKSISSGRSGNISANSGSTNNVTDSSSAFDYYASINPNKAPSMSIMKSNRSDVTAFSGMESVPSDIRNNLFLE